MNKDSTCLLDSEINTCIHYDVDTCMCKDEKRECGMFNKHYRNPKSKYVRKPRWYEKYYRKDSFVS